MAVTACRFFIRPFPVLLHELCVYGSSFFTSVSFSLLVLLGEGVEQKGYKGIFRPFQQRKRCSAFLDFGLFKAISSLDGTV